MNRVKEYYDVITEYLSLPIGTRYSLGLRLGVIESNILAGGDSDTMDNRIVVGMVKKEKFSEFKYLVEHFQALGGYDGHGYYH